MLEHEISLITVSHHRRRCRGLVKADERKDESNHSSRRFFGSSCLKRDTKEINQKDVEHERRRRDNESHRPVP